MFLRELFESTESAKKSVRIIGKMNGKVVQKEKHITDKVMSEKSEKKSIKDK